MTWTILSKCKHKTMPAIELTTLLHSSFSGWKELSFISSPIVNVYIHSKEKNKTRYLFLPFQGEQIMQCTINFSLSLFFAYLTTLGKWFHANTLVWMVENCFLPSVEKKFLNRQGSVAGYSGAFFMFLNENACFLKHHSNRKLQLQSLKYSIVLYNYKAGCHRGKSSF